MSAAGEPAPDPRTTCILPVLCLHPWAVPAPSCAASPPHTGTWGVLAAPTPFQLLRDSSTPEENQYFSTHQTKDRDKHFMGKGTRRMLLACLIPAAHPWVSASWLAVGNGTCFPSCCTVMLIQRQWKIGRVELWSSVKPWCIRIPGTRCAGLVPHSFRGTHWSWGEELLQRWRG